MDQFTVVVLILMVVAGFLLGALFAIMVQKRKDGRTATQKFDTIKDNMKDESQVEPIIKD